MKYVRLTQLTLTIILIPLLAIATANAIILTSTQNQVYSDTSNIAPGRIGLVLGCPPMVASGAPNTYFEQRMDAVAKLFKANKIRKVILSGATDGGSYNEPQAMKRALIKRGLRLPALLIDDRGNRTFDSLTNMSHDYNGQPIIIITQRSHARRALYLAKHLNIDAIAYDAQTDDFSDTLILTLRESLARVRAILDIYWPEVRFV